MAEQEKTETLPEAAEAAGAEAGSAGNAGGADTGARSAQSRGASQQPQAGWSATGTGPDPGSATPGPGKAAGADTAPPEDVEALRRELEAARRKADEHWDEYLRARAEAENVRRRAERDVEQARRYALERFVEALLPVRDSLELGLQAARQDHSDVAALLDKLVEGTELTLKLLTQALEKFGVKEVCPEPGTPFDPQLHEAMATQESDRPANTILHVVQKGYRLHDRLLRPAMVIVARPRSGGEDGGRAAGQTGGA